MNYHKPLISVIIPTWNEEKALTVAIDSMRHQTYENLEILVIDDQSTDHTRDIVESISKEDPRVRYLLCPHIDPNRRDWRGVNISVGWLARNYGMDNARGEWITYQDADDASLLNRIEAQHMFAEKYNATVACVSWQKFDSYWLNKKLDLGRIMRDFLEPSLIISAEKITSFAHESQGVLMRDWFPHASIPFLFQKWFPGARKLFFGNQKSYLGADNSMMFRREMVPHIRWRRLSERQWPSLGGRGVGRDFLCQATLKYRNSWTFNLPLYLWQTGTTWNPRFIGFEKYLIP